MSTLLEVSKSNRRKIKGPVPASQADQAASLAGAWEQMIARREVPEKLVLDVNPPRQVPPSPYDPPWNARRPGQASPRRYPKHVMRPSRRGLLVASGIGAGVLAGEAGVREYRRRRGVGKSVVPFVRPKVAASMARHPSAKRTSIKALRDRYRAELGRELEAANASTVSNGVRKDSDDLVVPELGIPAARWRANPISPLAMLASSNIMIDSAAAVMGRKLSSRQRNEVRRRGYDFAGARGMLFSPLGAGRSLVF